MENYANIGLLFNKHYFKEVDFNNLFSDNKRLLEDNENKLIKQNKKLYNSVLNNKAYNIGNRTIHLTTTYPGLLLGAGYPHETSIKSEIKLGVFFDYTSGLPVLPGSSVKGVLRNAFEVANGEYVKELLKEITKKDWTIKDINNLITDIFEGQENQSIYKRDIFFDAFPVGSIAKGKFLSNDYITPHLEPLKNPTPIQFLKILPNVSFQFNFELQDFKDENGTVLLTKQQKTELFKQILLDLGIGAKTNVGYGQFQTNPDKEKEMLKVEKLKELEKLKEAERLQKEKEEKEKEKLLKQIEEKEKEEHNRIENKHKNEVQLISNNKWIKLINEINDFNALKREIERLHKLAKNNQLQFTFEPENIKPIIKQCFENEKNNNRKKRDWKKKSKNNWYKIASWVGKDISDKWFDEFR